MARSTLSKALTTNKTTNTRCIRTHSAQLLGLVKQQLKQLLTVLSILAALQVALRLTNGLPHTETDWLPQAVVTMSWNGLVLPSRSGISLTPE